MEAKEKVAARVRRYRKKKKDSIEMPESPVPDVLVIEALRMDVTALQAEIKTLKSRLSALEAHPGAVSHGKVDASLFSRVVAEKERRLREA
jgi:hypothetical protein